MKKPLKAIVGNRIQAVIYTDPHGNWPQKYGVVFGNGRNGRALDGTFKTLAEAKRYIAFEALEISGIIAKKSELTFR
jgi:hypothetical protein